MGLVGGVSGGALGFIVDGVPGAFAGYKVGSALEDKKNLRKRLRESQANRPLKKLKTESGQSGPVVKSSDIAGKILPQKMPVKRVSRRRRVIKKVKKVKRPSAKRTRKVKKAASKFVRSVVDRALNCDLTTSVYRKYQTGEIVLDQSDSDVKKGYSLVFTGSTQGGIATRGIPAREAATMMWTFFTPKKMLDAASVLFNGKAAGPDYYIGVNNLAYTNLKLEVIYQSVKWEALNSTHYDIKYELYEFASRGNTDVSGGHEVVNSSSSGVSTSSYGGLVTQGIVDNSDSTGTVRPFRYSMPMLNKLSDYKGYEGKWSHKLVKKGTVLPGSRITYYMHEKPGCIEFKKFMNGDVLYNYGRGTRCLVLVVKSKMHSTLNPYVANKVRTGAHCGFAGAVDNSYGFPVAVTESFTIREPEEATVHTRQVLGYQDLNVENEAIDYRIAPNRVEDLKFQ